MFISFGMFIGLIIVTIIMIALIIYLTFTGGNKQPRHNKIHQAEEAAKERLAQNTPTPPSEQQFRQNNSDYHNEFRTESETKNHYEQNSHSQDIIEEEDPLQILPYPKDDDFK